MSEEFKMEGWSQASIVGWLMGGINGVITYLEAEGADNTRAVERLKKTLEEAEYMWTNRKDVLELKELQLKNQEHE